MAVIVEATVVPDLSRPASSPLRILQAVPDAEIELETFVPIDDRAVPYFWVIYDDLTEFEEVLRGDPAVTNVECLDREGDEGLYSVEWTVDDPTIECLRRANGSLMAAWGSASGWQLELRFEQDDEASAFAECCRARDLPITIDRVYPVADGIGGDPALTAEQREALLLAYEEGYFECPRETSQRDLGERLGISPTAVGTRLRRGLGTLVEESLVE